MPVDSPVRPFPMLTRPALRWALRRWTRTGRKTGRLTRLVEKWGPRLAVGPLPTRLPNGCRLLCDLTDYVQRQIYFKGLLAPVETYLFLQLLKPGMAVIDAGAHIGQYTLLAATAVGPGGAVHSFEPVPATFARLSEHVRDNRPGNVTLVQAALWSEDSTVNLGLSESAEADGNSGAWSIASASERHSDVRARALALDNYVEQHRIARVDAIKFDIEGAEPFALKGARATLARHHPVLLMEVNRPRLVELGSSPSALWAELHALGYRAFRITPSPRSSGGVNDLESVPELGNFIFHYNDLPDSVTSGWTRRGPKRWACSGW